MMQSTTEGCLNIAELANQLTREKIFISSERQLLQNLNEEVEKSALELLQAAWICSQQRQNLTDLINSRCEADSVAACQRASSLEGTTFIDVYKVLKYKEGLALGELLGWLRDSPHLVALCLLLGEECMSPTLPCALVSGLYGSCRLPADRTRLLAVLRSLVKHQLATSADPRKLFRSGKCALATLYGVFRDGHAPAWQFLAAALNAPVMAALFHCFRLFRSGKCALATLYGVFRDGHAPARQFLAAALNAPVMAALHEDEFFLDIHPDRAMERFSPQDRLKKFGQSNTAEYNAKVARYRKWIVQRLYQLTSKFISSLREHWANFPATIAWLIQQSVHLIKQHSRTSEIELHGLCTDLVLNHFICPAILNPEAHGIVDAPVSYIARTNLMQVAQILQVLCLAKHQEVEPKLVDLYSKFERSCVYSLVESVCSEALAPRAPAPPADSAAPRTDAPCAPAAALFAHSDLHGLITFLRRISSKLNNNTPSVTSEEMSSGSGPVAEAAAYSESGSDSSISDACASSLAALLQTMEPNYRSRLHDLLKKMPDLSKPRQSPPQPVDAADTQKKSILAKVPKPRLPRSGSSSASLAESTEELEVYVIQMARQDESDYVGLVPESKVLEWYCGGSEGDAEDAGSALVAAPGAPVQKRTRFSVSHDEVSLGNTSDNLEAVSEAASNHSVTSSLELETEDQNDNLSDMVSANVSGRGSPNISGRETPSSQVTDGDAANDPHRRLPQNVAVSQANSAQAKLLKQTRNDIEDKFCKFEIKKLLEGDECVSIMSDTWSTDVLASDSETVGDSCDQTLVAVGPNVVANTNAPDVSETASESAWSMDVLASDSDRNTEVDTDDCVSVAARSDTSWPRRLSQQEEPVPIKHNQNGAYKKPEVSNSPKHAPRPYQPNRSGGGYLSATAQLTRGAEVDLGAAHVYPENRKSILVNGYPVMTCYATSAPESPGAAPTPPNVFDYGPRNGETSQSSSTLEPANSQSDATSQWVDDSFPPPHRSPARKYDMPGPSHTYDEPDAMDRSLNSSESSFNALSVSQYDRRFDSGIDTERNDDRSVTDLMTRMSSATVSTSLANNVSRIKAEIRTSIVSISSSRIEKKRETSNISLSTLSVNSETSVSDRSSSQDVNSENVTERRVSPPPVKNTSTGAIPKSISFDATAEKSQRRRITEESLVSNLDELKNNMKRSGGNLLHKIKMFSRPKGRSHQHPNDIKLAEEEALRDDTPRNEPTTAESSDDILAKYRRKSSSESRRRSQRRVSDVPDGDADRCEGILDLNDPEVFNSMKKKLRLVLSNPELLCTEYVPNRCTSTSLVEWMRAAAAATESGAASAQAAEMARALAASGSCERLAEALRADLDARRPYAKYLASCRSALTHTLHALRRQINQVRTECSSCARAAAAARVLQQLERGNLLRRLARHHSAHNNHAPLNGGELMDEKAKRLMANIKTLIAEVKADPSWEGAPASLIEVLELSVERAAFGRLYLNVLFPVGDGDYGRDQVLSEHIRRLSGTSAARAGISARHLWAAPYARAQMILTHLSVYRTPRDKLQCVMRCVTCVMAVLGLTEGSAPSADDLTPVLVFIILKVNPPSLLSTIEFVNALAGAALQGPALYWWTQFCAAVAYIKTMDYGDS